MGNISQRSKKRAEKEFDLYFKTNNMKKEKEVLKEGDRVKTPLGNGEVFELSIALCFVDVNLDDEYTDDKGRVKNSAIFSLNQVEKL